MFNVQEELGYLIVEKRTREQYAIEKFKKKYNFEPTDKYGLSGWITVDGQRHKVHMSSGYSMMIDGKRVPAAAMTGMMLSKDFLGLPNPRAGELLLDKDFFKFKNGKRRDAFLQHELGHKALDHNCYPAYDSEVLIGMHGKERAKLKRYIDTKLIPKAKSDDHINSSEFEADRYSANRVGSKQLKRAIRNAYSIRNRKNGVNTKKGIYKQIKSTTGFNGSDVLDDDAVKKQIKDINSRSMDDMKYRSKALKDRVLQSAKL